MPSKNSTSTWRIFLGCWIIVSVLVIGPWVTPHPASSTVYAQPMLQSTLTPQAYLSLVMNNYCSGVGIKCWSGIHLGNRSNSDWNDAILQTLDPVADGTWPKAIVVLSSQIYQIQRYPVDHATMPCRVDKAEILMPVVFDYVKRAAQHGVRVVIRIYPSPGNFYDWDDPAQPDHHLSTGVPVGPEGYCRPDLYRSKADLADEMDAIHRLNDSYGFTEFGFEPANEPNVEWYEGSGTSVTRGSIIAWQEMDAYFAAVYDWAHTHYSGINVLTPPMGQGALAESMNLNGCAPMGLDEDPTKSGYDYMQVTYGTKNDGVNWHNYWIEGKEIYNFCENGGQHVSIYFPEWLRDAIRNGQKPATISEADLASPGQGMGNPITDKDAAPEQTADSMRHFFASEWRFGMSRYGVHAVTISWLLTDNSGTTEHDWHKAYLEDNAERAWFEPWYTESESWP